MKPMLKSVNAIACFGLLLSVVIGLNSAEGQVSNGASVIAVNGFVDVKFKDKERFVSLEEGMMLAVGDTIETDTEGEAELRLADKSILKIGPSSRVLIKELGTLEVTRVSVTTFELIKGKIRAIVSPLINEKSRFTIETTNATVGVRGTDFVESFDPDTESTYVIGLDDCVSLSFRNAPGSSPVSICGTEELTVKGREAPGLPSKASKETIDRTLREMGLTGKTGGEAGEDRGAPYITGIFVNRTIDLERIEGLLTLTRDDLSVDRTILLSGRSKDDVGRVVSVEVSLDGGATFGKATGTEDWTYEFEPIENREYEVMVRATNDAGLDSDTRDMGRIAIAFRDDSYDDVARSFIEAFINGIRTGDSRAVEGSIADGYDGAVGGFYSRDDLIQSGIEDLSGYTSGTTISYTIDQVSSLGDRIVVVTGWTMTSGTTSDQGKTTWWLSKSEGFRLAHAEGDWLLRSIETVEPAIWVEFYDNGMGPPCHNVAKVFLRASNIPDSVLYVQVQVETGCGVWNVSVDRWYYEAYVGEKDGFGSDVPLETMVSACITPSCATYTYSPLDLHFTCTFTDYGYDLSDTVTIP
jgi:hypothetical protein